MGHTRLGSIPKTRKWQQVASFVLKTGGRGGGLLLSDDVPKTAKKSLEAAQTALQKAVGDVGLRYTFYLLTQIVLAARETDWHSRLGRHGIHLKPDSSIFELTIAVQSAIDNFLMSNGSPTDVSEIAQQSAGEALSALAGPNCETLFDKGETELQQAIRGLSTKEGFSRLGQHFFGSFLSRFLNFYVSRVTTSAVGGRRIPCVGDLSTFDERLRHHCYESAGIVRDFCGGWYSKTEFKEGIDLENTSHFMAVALRKLRDELKQQEIQP